MKRYALVVAGGLGTRMQGNLPKQFMEILGEPILAHTLRLFNHPGLVITVVMHSDYLGHWETMRSRLKNLPDHSVVAGGATRAISVLNGLNTFPDEGLVAVHDAVRPMCSTRLVDSAYEAASIFGSAIPAIPCRDTLRELTDEGSITVPRERFRAVQTPQVFNMKALKKAFMQPGFEQFTDEASLFEADGNSVHLIPGEDGNLKITVPADLELAAALFSDRKSS